MDGKAELRRDAVSRDWILVAPKRGKRPHHFITPPQKPTPKSTCPFEKPHKGALLWYSRNGKENGPVRDNWLLQVIPNKFPAVAKHDGICPAPPVRGLHRKMEGIGYHDVVISRSHSKFLADMTPDEAELFVRAYQDRFMSIAGEGCIRYILIFHNQGAAAGASIWHPHSQIFALPIIPPDVYRSLAGSERYYKKHRRCVHCEMITHELKSKERFIYKNKEFVIVAPFASRVSFEMRIFPLRHEAHFERSTEAERYLLADALTTALRRLRKLLKNPAFNFFIHTAPAEKGKFQYYHWHLEILPKTAHLAGVELGSGIEIVAMPPERTAVFLRRMR